MPSTYKCTVIVGADLSEVLLHELRRKEERYAFVLFDDRNQYRFLNNGITWGYSTNIKAFDFDFEYADDFDNAAWV